MRDQAQRKAGFLRQAARAFEARTGLCLADVRPDVERLPDPILLSRVLASGGTPEGYVESVSRRCGLADLSELDADIRNRSTAELLARVALDPSWTLGRDGAAYRDDGDGIVRVAAHRGRGEGTSFGYDVSRSHAGRLTHVNGVARVEGAEFVAEMRGVELDDAIAPVHAPAMA
jgi:hypothetical protein